MCIRDSVSIGPIVYPVLLKQGYGRGFSAGLILAASTLAMLVPPSVSMILYSLATNTSVGGVFLSGLSAGLVFLVLLMLYCYLYAKIKQTERHSKASWQERLVSLKESGWSLGLPLIIFGGIYAGTFTPTEAASGACVSAWGWEQATGENPIVPVSGQGAERFFGTAGSLDFPTLKLWRDAAGGAGTWDRGLASKNIPLNRERSALKDQLSHFCALIKNDEQVPRVTAEDGLATLTATTAIIDSSEQKRPIAIN